MKKGFDKTIFSIYLGLLIIGWMSIYSVSSEAILNNGYWNSDAGKQSIWMAISILAFFIILAIDWKVWQTFAFPIYGIGITLLILVLLAGTTIKGSKSWFVLGGFSFQPSEIAKIATAIGLAGYLSLFKSSLKEIKTIVISIALILFPSFLILLQPDAGSGLVYFSFFIVLYREGLNPNLYLAGFAFSLILLFGLFYEPLMLSSILVLIVLIIIGFQFKVKNPLGYFLFLLGIMACAYVLSNAGFQKWVTIGLLTCLLLMQLIYRRKFQDVNWVGIYIFLVVGSTIAHASNYAFNNLLKYHQQERINVWLRPELSDPKGSLYNVIQSQIAIGSGGWNGKGFNEGTLTRLNYVPEQSTDFIFCTIGEEQGFIGTFAVIGIYLLLLIRLVSIAERQRSNFSRIFIYGVAGIFFIHYFINIAMTMGIMPIIGIPLPLISKGGSALLGFSIMLAIVLKLDRHRYSI
jgi:rod shape determining protein RodA